MNPPCAPVRFEDLLLAVEGDLSGAGQAYVSRVTGQVHVAMPDFEEELPEDIDDESIYLQLPTRRDLDLGKPLVIAFTKEFLPSDVELVYAFFRKKGAYRAFSELLHRRQKTKEWYAYQAAATERAVLEWCLDHGITLSAREEPT